MLLPEGALTLPKGFPMPSTAEALSLENMAGRPEGENLRKYVSFWKVTSSTKRFQETPRLRSPTEADISDFGITFSTVYIAFQQKSPLKSRASAAKRTWGNRGVLHGTRDVFKDDTHLDRCLRSQIDVLESRGFVPTRREQMCFNHTGAVPRGSKLSPRVTTAKHASWRAHLFA